jgi:hypothetical protein
MFPTISLRLSPSMALSFVYCKHRSRLLKVYNRHTHHHYVYTSSSTSSVGIIIRSISKHVHSKLHRAFKIYCIAEYCTSVNFEHISHMSVRLQHTQTSHSVLCLIFIQGFVFEKFHLFCLRFRIRFFRKLAPYIATLKLIEICCHSTM